MDARIEKLLYRIKEVADNTATSFGIYDVLQGIVSTNNINTTLDNINLEGIADHFINELQDKGIFNYNKITDILVKDKNNPQSILSTLSVVDSISSNDVYTKVTYATEPAEILTFGCNRGISYATFTSNGTNMSYDYKIEFAPGQNARKMILETGLNAAANYNKIFRFLEHSKEEKKVKSSAIQPQRALTTEEEAEQDKKLYVERQHQRTQNEMAKIDTMSNEFYYSLGFLAATADYVVAEIPVSDLSDKDAPCKYTIYWFKDEFQNQPWVELPVYKIGKNYNHYGPVFKIKVPSKVVPFAPEYLTKNIQSRSLAKFGKNEEEGASCLGENGILSNKWLISLLVQRYGFNFVDPKSSSVSGAPTKDQLLNILSGSNQAFTDAMLRGFEDGENALKTKVSRVRKDTPVEQPEVDPALDAYKNPLGQDFPDPDDGLDEAIDNKKHFTFEKTKFNLI